MASLTRRIRDEMQHVVNYSGGTASFAAAKIVIDEHGPDNVTLLFADTTMEDDDLYRFLDESSAFLGVPITTVRDGRDPWEVFFDERYLGNTRADPCSKILKRHLLDKWREENCDATNTIVHVGYTFEEVHRIKKLAPRMLPWIYRSPLVDRSMFRRDAEKILAESGIRRPRLYDLGFPHNNCGGFCVKAGQAHFVHLLKVLPERFAYHERKEQEFRDFIGTDVAILRDRRGGVPKPLTLRELRERHESGDIQLDLFDWGGCGCAFGEEGE